MAQVSPTQVNANDEVTAASVNTPNNQLAAGINNIDNSQIVANAAIAGSKLANNSVDLGNVALPWDGWLGITDTWTYASATTITVPSDATTRYAKGDKIRLTQTTRKYFYIVGVTSTTLTVTGGTDYTLTNAPISGIAYSKVENPLDFPIWLNYTPTITFTGTAPTSSTAGYALNRFRVVGSEVRMRVYRVYSGAGVGDTGVQVTPPIAASSEGLAGAAVNVMSGSIAYTGGSATVITIYDSGIATVNLTFGSVALTQFGVNGSYAI